ncbi:lysozyme [Izhakiella capsodis]|uniref:Lysozyme n=1 Tax=Izhakiella capsodis TaxID=1367852 RepID=A0A1I5BP76_9GAMM|nr:lysozyme [Izhakiella capsodis]SFN76523.1 lysozyme [Izhakiella capsodis]
MSGKIKTGLAGGICSVAVIIGLVIDKGQVRTNQRGLELIGNAEGCRRDPYHCPAGILTDGIGNTHGVKPGARKTDKQIAADWQKNILDAERCVNRYANGAKLPENTFSAAVEITFNVGCPTMQKSTMFRLFRQGKLVAACNELPRWVYANGKKLNGLVTRRAESEALCLEGLK